ncbi:hypothetical protein HK101_000807 [Irineochytrium annulatum]|nr:hypothetical protein HK101_000807 [Irineochytrium annulatum]
MNIQSFIHSEMEQEARDYFERKHINQILESILTGLTFARPEDPLAYIEECIGKLRKADMLGGKLRIPWDAFIPVPSKEATNKRKENHKKAGVVDRPSFVVGKGKPHHNMPTVPLLPPVKGAFMMPDIQAKQLTLTAKGSAIVPAVAAGSGVHAVVSGTSNNVVLPPAATASLKQKEPLPVLPTKPSAVFDTASNSPPLNHPNVIFVLGGPGSGKGTQCVRLAKEFNYTHLSAGDLLRAELDKGSEIGRQCGDLMKEGKIVPQAIMIGLLKKAMLEHADTPGFLIDGFPRALEQAYEFERVIGRCRLVLFFSCPLNVLEERLLERGKTSGRADDNIDTIKKRFKTFEDQSMPVVDHYELDGRVVKISSTKTIEEVYAETRAVFVDGGDAGAKAGAGGIVEAKKAPLPPISKEISSMALIPAPQQSPMRMSSAEPPAPVAVAAPVQKPKSALPAIPQPEKTRGPEWQNIVFVLGGPGCGKGTQCVRLAEEFNLTHLSAGDLLRAEVASGSERAKELDMLMKEGKIVPMEVTIKLLQEAMEASSGSSGFLIDGFPRQLDQAIAFEETVAPCRMALYFDCPENVLEQRLLKRGETSGRADDNIDTIMKRFKTFVNTSMPVIEHFKGMGKCVQISSVAPVEDVYTATRGHFVDPTKPIAKTRGPEWQNIVFVLGGPGCGKGTQCVRLAKEFNLTHLSAGDLLRAEVESGSARAKELDTLMKEGKIVPMEVTIGLLKEAMEASSGSSGFLIDGFPRQLDQAIAFERTVAPCRFALFFDCPENILEQRLLKRGETSGRADDNIETILKRFRTFVNTSMPVIDHFKEMGKCVKISSVAPVDDVYMNTRGHFVDPTKPIELPIDHHNLIFVLGGPGSGKGTQCAKIAAEFNYAHLSAGDLLRAEVDAGTDVGKMCGEMMKEGKIVPMEITIGLLRNAINANIQAPGILIDGFPRALEQAKYFESSVAKPSKILFFNCPLETLEERLLERGKTSGRADDNIDTIRKRFKTFQDQSMPVVDYFNDIVHRIESTDTIENVYTQVRRIFAPLTRPFENEKIVFVLGGPGSGKGTQCDRLAGLGFAHLSTGDLLRDEVKKGTPLGLELEETMKEGKMVPLFEETIGPCKFVLFFDASNEVLEKRLLKRGETSGRADDNLESIKKRLTTFHEASMPVVSHYEAEGRVRRIPADGEVESITEATMKCFEAW